MKAQDYKDIKIANIGTQKVLSVNEILWQKKSLGPGPSKLIGGNLQAGFYGEVPTSDFITGSELANRIGLTAGYELYGSDVWLKFSYLGKIEFISKKPFRFRVAWDDIKTINAVYGNRIIEIGGIKYKVRLIKGKTEGKQNDMSDYEGDISKNSEWNRLMLPIHKDAPSNWRYKDNVEYPTENWNIGYTNEDLCVIGATETNGSATLCQEYATDEKKCVSRGFDGISYSLDDGINLRWSYMGWRPVLELVD